MFNRRSLRLTNFLALFALVWGLVFPTLANAGVGNANSVWAEVCTANGIKRIQQSVTASDGHEQANTANTAGHQYTAGHCALCCLGGSLPAVAPLTLHDGVQLQLQARVLSSPQAFFPQQVTLLTAAPRAPPSLL
jgi:hypothetical protein